MGNFRKWIKTKNEDTQHIDPEVTGVGASSFNRDMGRLSGHMADTDLNRRGKLQRLGTFLASLGYGADKDQLFADIRLILNNPERYGLTQGSTPEETGV